MNQPETNPEVAVAAKAAGTALISFGHTDETLILLREQAKEVHLVALDDEASLKKVHDTRMLLKGVRVAIEKKRKELKDESLKRGQMIDSEAKRLTAIIEPQETRLADEEASVERERERLEREAAEKRQAVIASRVREVAEAGALPNMGELASMPDEAYSNLIARLRAEKAQRENEERMKREQAEADDRARAAHQKQIDDARAEELRQMRERQAALDLRQREQDEREARLKKAADAIAATPPLQASDINVEAYNTEVDKLMGIPAEILGAPPQNVTATEVAHRTCPTCGQHWPQQ